MHTLNFPLENQQIFYICSSVGNTVLILYFEDVT